MIRDRDHDEAPALVRVLSHLNALAERFGSNSSRLRGLADRTLGEAKVVGAGDAPQDPAIRPLLAEIEQRLNTLGIIANYQGEQIGRLERLG